MTVCTECNTHIGPTRTTCGSCHTIIQRNHPEGPVHRAYNTQGQLIFMRRPNKEHNQPSYGPVFGKRSDGYLSLDLLDHIDDDSPRFGRMFLKKNVR